MRTLILLLMSLVVTGVSAPQGPEPEYAPVNGLQMYYEVHGSGEPVVLLHGAFMAIAGDWSAWIDELSKTRKVIAIEMQGHGRTADIDRDMTYENLADDVAGLLDFLKIPSADIVGYSLGGGVAIECAIRHPDKVRKVVSISAPMRRDGWVKEANDFWPAMTWEMFKGSAAEAGYKKLSPTPDKFPDFVNHVKALALRPYDLGADNLKATKAPMFFIHGDADGVRPEHIAEMYRLKGGEVHGDMKPRSASRLAILPNTTHVTLMQRRSVIVPMVNEFLDARAQPGPAAGKVSLSSEQVLKIARDAVAANDTWLENAEFETPEKRPDGSWTVTVWRVPKTPGGHRLILIDQKGTVTAYERGK